VRTIGIVLGTAVILAGWAARESRATDSVGAISLTVVENGATRMLVDAAGDDVMIACTKYATCQGAGCTPIPAFLMTVATDSMMFRINVTLPDPSVVGTTLIAESGGRSPSAGHAQITIVTTGAGWMITGGAVRVDANELPTTANHLDLTLMGVTDAAGRTLDGTISCINVAQPVPPGGRSGGGCGGGGGGGGVDD
jgi:hypothetical protein